MKVSSPTNKLLPFNHMRLKLAVSNSSNKKYPLRKISTKSKATVSTKSQTNTIKLSAISAKSFATSSMKSLQSSDLSYCIELHLLSNYGDNDYISISEIDVLCAEKVPVQDVTITPLYLKKYQGHYEYLTNHNILKNNDDPCWVEKWDPRRPLILNVSFQSPCPPEYIRIFNTSTSKPSNIKNFSIFIDKTFIFSGEVPPNFGTVASLRTANLPKIQPMSLFSMHVPSCRNMDESGRMPIRNIKNLDICILKTYDPQNKYAGLNALEFYDCTGTFVPFSMVEEMSTYGCQSVSSPFNLLKNSRRTVSIDAMWLCSLKSEKDEGIARLRITFEQPIALAFVRIWNYNGSGPNYGIRRVRLTADEEPFFVGALRPAKQMRPRIETGVTDVWAADHHNWENNKPLLKSHRTMEDFDALEIEFAK